VSSRAAEPPVPFVGLTGAVAAGKSEALAAFARLGAATLSTDAVVHELLGGEEMAAALADRWGREVAPEGVVDRARVGAIVFEKPEELGWLEERLHPVVGERVVAWRAQVPRDASVAVVEVPLLFEAGMEGLFDATVCVVAPDDVRAARAGARGIEALEARSTRQLSQDEKASRATHVVPNDGTAHDLERRLAALIPELQGVAGAA
jgi:dephospho-CoA kinase